MDKYYVVFRVNRASTAGIELLKRMDIDDPLQHLKGFGTKRAMLDWIETNKEGLDGYQMLKPID